MTGLKPIQARILLQVREGVPNVLLEFELTPESTTPSVDGHPDAVFDHEDDMLQIIRALNAALNRQMAEYNAALAAKNAIDLNYTLVP